MVAAAQQRPGPNRSTSSAAATAAASAASAAASWMVVAAQQRPGPNRSTSSAAATAAASAASAAASEAVATTPHWTSGTEQVAQSSGGSANTVYQWRLASADSLSRAQTQQAPCHCQWHAISEAQTPSRCICHVWCRFCRHLRLALDWPPVLFIHVEVFDCFVDCDLATWRVDRKALEVSISFGMKVPSPGIWGKCQISCPRQKLTVLKKCHMRWNVTLCCVVAQVSCVLWEAMCTCQHGCRVLSAPPAWRLCEARA